jgi:multidrug efflux pump subunit AcrB
MSDRDGRSSLPASDGSWLGRVVDVFLRGDLAGLLIVLSLAGGFLAIVSTPREEEPQIVVPTADVRIEAPGLSVEEVERQISTRLEKLLLRIEGVEHVYSMSLPGRAVVTVRFHVGEDREESLVELHDALESNRDLVPPDVRSWVVKPVEIDDVPIVIATLWSEDPERIDDHALRRIAEELEIQLQTVAETNRTSVVGGRPREIRVELRPEALAARQTSIADVVWALGVSNERRRAGGFDRADRAFVVDAGDFFPDAAALRRAVVNVVDGRPVHLDDVATVIDGPAEATSHTSIGFGPAEPDAPQAGRSGFLPAVHVAVAKERGTNAVHVAERLRERVAELAPTLLPEGVHVRFTRDQGETANHKVNELLEGFAVAILIVIALIAWSLGWREGLVVAVAVPITFSLTLLVNWAAGYSINRVTLFALILSLGLVVDDPIVDVENIYRHLRAAREEPLAAVRRAVNEVRPPILYATLAVIVSFLPMNFITGMMGPYMRPMALNVPVAMAMSMVVAFTITPWLAWRALRASAARAGDPDVAVDDAAGLRRFYARLLGPFLDDHRRTVALLLGTFALFAYAGALAALRAVPLKMLPFDNKDEFQIVIDPPEGTSLERTDAIARELAGVLRTAPEVRDFEIYSGIASPMDFNAMVRRYFLRESPHTGEIRVNLAPRRSREMQSHEIVLRLREELDAVAKRNGARIAVVESPPGPPVLATIVAEVRGSLEVPYDTIREAALGVAARLREEPGVADVDTSVEADASRLVFVTDVEKAALSGVSSSDVATTLETALEGRAATRLHDDREVHPLPVRLRLSREERSGEALLASLPVLGRPGIVKVRDEGGLRDAPQPVVRLGEIGGFETRPREKALYHKNLERVAYVYAEPVGRSPAEVVADVAADLGVDSDPSGIAPSEAARAPRPLDERTFLSSGGGLGWRLPAATSVTWLGEGELEITRDVFRDLGIAFGVAILGIYGLLVVQTRSWAMPSILMISIPLTMIGIMPGFWLLNALFATPVGGFENPVFFTATAMIGMIALSGIAVRNAILLIEFAHLSLAEGMPLREALIEAGAVRTRPIFLTAGTALLAAIPITLDPIFSGLAWALIFGLVVSTAFTLLVVPVTYYLVYRNRPGHGLTVPRGEGSS